MRRWWWWRRCVMVVVVLGACARGRVLSPSPRRSPLNIPTDEGVWGAKLQDTREQEQNQHLMSGNAPEALPQQSLPEAEDLDHLDPEVTGGFFQGDMAGLEPEETIAMNTRVALKWSVFPERKWTNGTVPYVISDLYLPNERQMIETAISTLDFLSCLRFEPWDGLKADYLEIMPATHPKGCWSFVGRRGGRQVLSLEPPNHRSKRCFVSLGKPIHELLHTLGFFHEQARADRDDYVWIVEDNIIPGRLNNFKKQSAENTTFPFPYDYSSVMHYGSRFYSFNRDQPTIVPKTSGVTIGQRVMLSKVDCLKLNDAYDCFDDPHDKIKYTAFCNFLGIL